MTDPYLQRIALEHAALGIPAALVVRRNLPMHREPAQLVVTATCADGNTLLLTAPAAEAWLRMRAAAQADGVAMTLVSAFRSVDAQCGIVRRKLAAGMAIDAILQSVAPPGYSEHHTGRAIDIGTTEDDALEEIFEDTPAFAWLRVHAAAFGFTMSYPAGNAQGFVYEPWHWCYVTA